MITMYKAEVSPTFIERITGNNPSCIVNCTTIEESTMLYDICRHVMQTREDFTQAEPKIFHEPHNIQIGPSHILTLASNKGIYDVGLPMFMFSDVITISKKEITEDEFVAYLNMAQPEWIE